MKNVCKFLEDDYKVSVFWASTFDYYYWEHNSHISECCVKENIYKIANMTIVYFVPSWEKKGAHWIRIHMTLIRMISVQNWNEQWHCQNQFRVWNVNVRWDRKMCAFSHVCLSMIEKCLFFFKFELYKTWNEFHCCVLCYETKDRMPTFKFNFNIWPNVDIVTYKIQNM